MIIVRLHVYIYSVFFPNSKLSNFFLIHKESFWVSQNPWNQLIYPGQTARDHAIWSHGQLLVWNATCPDTMAHSYRSLACSGAGKVAAAAEHRKLSKYAHLGQAYQFMPVAIETLGAYGPKTASFIKEFGRRVAQESGIAEHRAF